MAFMVVVVFAALVVLGDLVRCRTYEVKSTMGAGMPADRNGARVLGNRATVGTGRVFDSGGDRVTSDYVNGRYHMGVRRGAGSGTWTVLDRQQ